MEFEITHIKTIDFNYETEKCDHKQTHYHFGVWTTIEDKVGVKHGCLVG